MIHCRSSGSLELELGYSEFEAAAARGARPRNLQESPPPVQTQMYQCLRGRLGGVA